MAIIIENRKSNFNFFTFLFFIFLFFVVIGGAYYLFFAPTPGIEIVAPSSLQSSEEIADVKFDPGSVIGDPVLKNLRQFGAPPEPGDLGRSNPFSSF
ncbi:MAG: hypothetical protein FJY91_02515 [Candidatus Harrisonbacteria bacterium]|nr:hypothetical protein [Candidatus Harrisonbacteria bacterium]